MLSDFLKNMLILSDKELVMTILDTIEYLFNLDINYGLHDTQSFKYLLETQQCFDLLEDL